MAFWTVRGQAGQGMDATTRDFDAVGALSPKLTFRNMGTDTLTYSLLLEGFAPSGVEIIPTQAQTLELFRNGTRFFKGHVTGVKQRGRTVDITVSGPWWWLERMFLDSLQTDETGATANRNTYVFPAQDLTSSLSTLLNLAITQGAPMGVGGLASTFNAPEFKLNQTNLAQAIAEVMRITPDIVMWWNYSGTTPTANTARRLSAGSINLDANTVESFELNPITELEVQQVRVPYLIRAANGAKKFATQNSGTAATGKVQIFTVSGGEMDTFLPKDLLDSVEFKTRSATITASLATSYDKAANEVWAQFNEGIGPVTRQFSGDLQTTQAKRDAGGNYILGPGLIQTDTAPLYYGEAGQIFGNGSGMDIIVGTEMPDWAIEQLGGFKVTAKGIFYGYQQNDAAGNMTGGFSAMARRGSAGVAWNVQIRFDIYETPFSYTAILLPAGTRYRNGTTLYRKSDYGFRFPPSGFAAGLLNAQNYIPYEGNITVAAEEAGAVRYMSSGINLTNSLAAHSSMKAMVTEEELDLESGTTRITLGRPLRFSYKTLVDSMRTNSNDQITYLP